MTQETIAAAPVTAPPVPRVYFGATIALGFGVLAFTAMNWESPDLLRFGCFLLVALGTCGMRIAVPGLATTIPLTFLFVLFGVIKLSTAETIVLGALVTLAQCYWNQRRPRGIYVLFHVASMVLAVAATTGVYHAAAMADADV